jgi:hypothetical protein
MTTLLWMTKPCRPFLFIGLTAAIPNLAIADISFDLAANPAKVTVLAGRSGSATITLTLSMASTEKASLNPPSNSTIAIQYVAGDRTYDVTGAKITGGNCYTFVGGTVNASNVIAPGANCTIVETFTTTGPPNPANSASNSGTWAIQSLFVMKGTVTGFQFAQKVSFNAIVTGDFWLDFDTQTLFGQGDQVNAVYLPGVASPNAAQLAKAKNAVRTDIFTGFSNFAQQAINLEILQSHGLPVPAGREKEITTYYNDLLSSGVLDRLSKLQLGIITKHFPAGGGGIDFTKFQKSVEMFANGELATHAPGAAGQREMDQLAQWYVWKLFAEVAITNNVDASDWENIIHSLEKGLEIYRLAYPAPVGGFPYLESSAARFNSATKLSAAQLDELRNQIDSLTVTDVLQRELNALKLDTPGVGAAGAMLTIDPIQIASVSAGFQVNLSAHLTSASGAPINGDPVELEVSSIGIEVPGNAFGETMFLTDLGNGAYSTSFTVPTPPIGTTLLVLDKTSLAGDAVSFTSETATTVNIDIPAPVYGVAGGDSLYINVTGSGFPAVRSLHRMLQSPCPLFAVGLRRQ